MKRLLLSCLFLSELALAVGSVTVTRSFTEFSKQSAPKSVEVVKFAWVGDAADGSVPATSIYLSGHVMKAITVPASPAPTASYGITFVDPLGASLDALNSALTSLSASLTAQIYPKVFLAGSYTFTLTGNSVVSAQGAAYLYIVDSSTIASSGGGSSPLTAKGDIYTRSATSDCRLGVGTNGQILTADSAQACGNRWATASGTGNVTQINADATPAQTLTVGLAGTDFAVVDNAAGNHLFNLPSASGTARGLVKATGAQTLGIDLTLTGASPVFSVLTATTVPYLNGTKQLTSSAVTPTELGFVSGVTSALQTQIGLLAPKASPAFTGTIGTALTLSRAVVTDVSSNLVSATTTAVELGFVSGVSSAIQTQINTKAPSASPSFTTQVTFGNYHLEPCENNAGNTGAALTLDLSNCASQKATATANVTFTFSNPVIGGSYVFHLVQDATGSRSYIWPAGVKWSGGTAPAGSGANKQDIVSCYYDGTSYFCTSSLNY